MRLRITLMLLGAILVTTTFTFPLWQPLFEATTEAELLPGLLPDIQAAYAALPLDQQRALSALLAEDQQAAALLIAAAVAPDTLVSPEDQELPSVTAATRSQRGQFRRIDSLRYAEGRVVIYEWPDNRKLVSLEGFSAARGPDLRVILSASPNPQTPEEVQLNNVDLELGPLKGNIGSQHFELPPDVDLSRYASVVIFSPLTNLVFSSAPL
ncbi:MAG: DM13 domain-containing protein [Aggregatilineales bacterium]